MDKKMEEKEIIAVNAWDILRHKSVKYYMSSEELASELLKKNIKVIRQESCYGNKRLYFCDESSLSIIHEFIRDKWQFYLVTILKNI